MGLLKDWRDHAYGLDDRTPEGKRFWLNYFQVEKGIYEQILSDPKTVVSGTVKELAEKYDTTIELITGFLDGIDESLKESNNLEEIEEDSKVTLDIDLEKLYMAMVACGVYKDVESAAAAIVRVVDTVEPDPELVARYRDRYREFIWIYPAMKPLFHQN